MPSLDRADSDVTLVDGTSNKGEMTKAALASKIVDVLTGPSVDALPGAFVDSFTGAPDGSCDMDLDGGKAMNVDGEKPVDGQAMQSAIIGHICGDTRAADCSCWHGEGDERLRGLSTTYYD